MTHLCFQGGTLILPDRVINNGTVICVDGRIHSISDNDKHPTRTQSLANHGETIDLSGRYLCPGFVDLHLHGGADCDFMDGTLESVQTICRAHATHGTTTLFPTTSTGTRKQIHQMIDACANAQRLAEPNSGASIGGIHLYGPYFAKDKAGCHLDNHCRQPESEEFSEYFDSGMIRIATCAAELPGAVEFYQAAERNNCLITCGHSNASWTQMQTAFDAGMRHVDHFWCAMSSVASVRKQHGFPMQGSMLEFVLAQPEMSTEVIADGEHLSAELLNFAWKMKSSKRLCLVTDCNRALDMPPGRYRFGSHEDGSWFESDGLVGRASADALASSVRGMDHMVRTMLAQTQASLSDVIRMATLTPAERVGVGHEIGSIESGKAADLLVLNQQYYVEKVFIGGKHFPII